ncbi:MAG: hypothetical protein EBX30_11555, partial [Betaproteobacteria bacterium]|nr:hypothetical protein [Betaproteobacteria bacterium]
INKDFASFEDNALNRIKQVEGRRYQDAISARQKLISLIQDQTNGENLSAEALKQVTEYLQDGDAILASQARSIGVEGKLLALVTAELKAGKSLQEIQKSEAFETLKLAEKELEKVQDRYAAQEAAVKQQEHIASSYENANKLLETTLQHSNTLFFNQVDVKQVLEDQKRVREDLISLAQIEGAAVSRPNPDTRFADRDPEVDGRPSKDAWVG